MIEVWTVTHNTHPSGLIETLVFPNEKTAWICWVQLVGVAWNKWFGEDSKLYPGGDAAALIIETIPRFPYQVRKQKHPVNIKE